MGVDGDTGGVIGGVSGVNWWEMEDEAVRMDGRRVEQGLLDAGARVGNEKRKTAFCWM